MTRIFVYPQRIPRKSRGPISLSRFAVYAVCAYSVFILFFAGIYLIFIQDYNAGASRWQSTLLIRGQPVRQFIVPEAIYFSAITTFTIGYGDIIPLGWCKLVAVIEGFCGYLAPTLCVAVGLSVLLNHRHDYLRHIRRAQHDLLKLVFQGWELTGIWPGATAQHVVISLRHKNGAVRQVEMEYCCLDFSHWRKGYLSAWEEKSLHVVESWLRKLKK